MRKIIFLFFVRFLFFNAAKAQTWVTIPDANFVSYLQSSIPTAMNGNQLNTSSPAVATTHTINVTGLNISDLNGLQYFSSLTNLTCNANLLTSLTVLPNTLTYLSCPANSLTSLPTLPNSITFIQCDGNSLTSLPALPTSLASLHCESNQLTTLPTLPNSLNNLYCNYNVLTSLPALPNSLVWVECYNNKLTSLPAFSNAQTFLDCSYNHITSIPSMPVSLQSLYCEYNNLTILPPFPSAFTYLDCSVNNLSNLPVLPSGLQYLRCRVNHITGFSSFPNSLNNLICDSNAVTCFPPIPNNFASYNFNIDNNPYNCLPNYISAMTSSELATQLCAAGNTNGCPVATGITQTVITNDGINIFPNPSNGNVSIANERNIDEIKIIDLLDQLIYEDKPNSQKISLSIENSGIYFVTITAGDKNITQKIIVSK